MLKRTFKFPVVSVLLKLIVALIILELVRAVISTALFHNTSLHRSPTSIQDLEKTFLFFILDTAIIFLIFLKDILHVRDLSLKYHQTKQNYQSLFHFNPDPVCLMDLEGRILNANDAFQAYAGYNVEQLRQLPGHAMAAIDKREEVMTYFEQAKSGQAVRFMTQGFDSSGIRHEADVTFLPMSHHKRIYGVYVIVKDITARVETMRRLLETEDMLDTFINQTSDAVVIYKPDRTILRINQAYTTLFGWTADELVGHKIPEEIFGDSLGEATTQIEEILKQGTLYSQEIVRYRRDGQPVDLNMTATPITDKSSTVVAIAVVLRDISVQKQDARKIQEAARLLESLFRFAGDAINLVSTEGKVILVNPAWEKLFGWSYEEVVGKPSPTLLNFNNFQKVLDGGEVVSQPRIKHRKDGSEIYVSITVSPIYSDFDTVIGVAFFYKDLTEHHRIEHAMFRAEKLAVVGELAASIGHEIRNPLTAIKGFLQLMESKQLEPEHVDVIMEEVEQITKITDNLLLLSKPQKYQWKLEEFNYILDEVVLLMRPLALIHNIEISHHLDDRIQLQCIRQQIRQVLINLMKNSIEALPKGGKISLSAKKSGNMVKISLSDNGPGIPEDAISKLGQPFYTTKVRGTGLGLMVSYRIIQNHGGTIFVNSHLGTGTTFEIELPMEIESHVIAMREAAATIAFRESENGQQSRMQGMNR